MEQVRLVRLLDRHYLPELTELILSYLLTPPLEEYAVLQYTDKFVHVLNVYGTSREDVVAQLLENAEDFERAFNFTWENISFFRVPNPLDAEVAAGFAGLDLPEDHVYQSFRRAYQHQPTAFLQDLDNMNRSQHLTAMGQPKYFIVSRSDPLMGLVDSSLT